MAWETGKQQIKNQHYYLFSGHLIVTINGVVSDGVYGDPATGDEREAFWDLTEDVQDLRSATRYVSTLKDQ